MNPGAKAPGSRMALNVRAEARTYLRNNNGRCKSLQDDNAKSEPEFVLMNVEKKQDAEIFASLRMTAEIV